MNWSQQQVKIDVQNVGNGPAFNIRSVIYGPEATAVPNVASTGWSHRSDEKENHWYDWTTDAVRPGKKKALEYALAGTQSPIKFAKTYKHIQPKGHKQKPIPFNAPAQPLAPPSQTEPWCVCRVTITYHDIFHRKHASIYDLIFRQGWQVIAMIDDISKDLSDLVG